MPDVNQFQVLIVWINLMNLTSKNVPHVFKGVKIQTSNRPW